MKNGKWRRRKKKNMKSETRRVKVTLERPANDRKRIGYFGFNDVRDGDVIGKRRLGPVGARVRLQRAQPDVHVVRTVLHRRRLPICVNQSKALIRQFWPARHFASPLTSSTNEQMAVYSVTGLRALNEITIRLGPKTADSLFAQLGSASTWLRKENPF